MQILGFTRNTFISAAGKAFGEIALLNDDSVRTASIISDEECYLMVINRNIYNSTIKVTDYIPGSNLETN